MANRQMTSHWSLHDANPRNARPPQRRGRTSQGYLKFSLGRGGIFWPTARAFPQISRQSGVWPPHRPRRKCGNSRRRSMSAEMNKYLLDTNVLSELRKPKPHGAVVAWLRDLREKQVFLSAVTLGRLQAGVERTRHQDPPKANQIEAWVDRLGLLVPQGHHWIDFRRPTCREVTGCQCGEHEEDRDERKRRWVSCAHAVKQAPKESRQQ